jgi:rod shape-determining protein MreC
VIRPNKLKQLIKKNRYLKYFLIAVLIFFLDFSVFFKPVKNAFAWLTRPFRQETYQLSSINLGQVFYSQKVKNLEKTNQELEDQVALLETDLAKYQQLSDENRRLKSLINNSPAQEAEFLPALVIGRQGDYLIINKGKKDGLEEDWLVITDQYLVGRVKSVFEKESKVITVGSGSLELPVIIFADSSNCLKEDESCQKGRGIIRGDLVEEILQEEDIKKGDLVALLDDNLGILIGRVDQVKENQDEIFKQAKINLAADLAILSEVFLVKE